MQAQAERLKEQRQLDEARRYVFSSCTFALRGVFLIFGVEFLMTFVMTMIPRRRNEVFHSSIKIVDTINSNFTHSSC